MPISRLNALQLRILQRLASIEPRWTLTGGGALVGFRTFHRETRDLDLFFRGQQTLGGIVDDVRAQIEAGGMTATPLRTSAMFAQLSVGDGESTIVVDLISDPTPLAEEPESMLLNDTTILVETSHQLLVNKLCALLSRSEIRDLVDVRELVARGGDLRRALEDCPRHDAGFSPLTFGWAMTGLHLERLGAAVGMTEGEVRDLVEFRDKLVERVLAEARPEP